MNDWQLEKCLNVVGKGCFAYFYEDFADQSLTRLEIAEILMEEREYTEKACYERIRHARRIIYANRSRDALLNIAYSTRVDPEVVDIAHDLLAKIPQSLPSSPSPPPRK